MNTKWHYNDIFASVLPVFGVISYIWHGVSGYWILKNVLKPLHQNRFWMGECYAKTALDLVALHQNRLILSVVTPKQVNVGGCGNRLGVEGAIYGSGRG